MNRMLLGYNPDFDAFDAEPAAVGGRARRGPAPVFGSVDTMGLAIELLEVQSAAQLGATVERIVRRAGAAVGRPLAPAVARALAQVLQPAAQRALPGRGASGDSDDAKAAGRFFGLELEGLSPEDQEFETAKAFVRLAGEAARQASLVPLGLAPPQGARWAALQSARRHAPGWPQPPRPGAPPSTTGPQGSPTGAGSASIHPGVHHA